ncbi:hypothetical protein C4573_04165 [Candidatus Woesearchaeota archaeon]|nr:MAG: hypothetical protein C4573_04165 [Candidatus Woesearchaeota archaeon]
MAKLKNKLNRINIWKIVAMVFIVLFVVVIALGLFKAHRFKPEFHVPTADQVSFAKNIAVQDLQAKNEPTINLSVKTSNEIRSIPVNGALIEILEVSLYNSSVRHLYIVDVYSGAILVYSKTEFYDGINHSIDGERRIEGKRFAPR